MSMFKTRSTYNLLFALTLFNGILREGDALNNGVGLTPAMGYNTWNDFQCRKFTSIQIMQIADKMVDLGLVKLGYTYLNLDDCWQSHRDNVTHLLVPDPTIFPQGVSAVSSYVHSKGLKFGMYTDRGHMTCAHRPGSLGFETLDAQQFADWGVDYLKVDSCFASHNHSVAFEEYALFRDGLNHTKLKIYLSLCGWNPWYAPKGASLGNSWRVAGDIRAWFGVYRASRTMETLNKFAGPGGWNDPDMLLGSTPSAFYVLTPRQSRTQFSLWAVLSAPLLIGSSLLNLSSFDLETYSNKEVIDVDQDTIGVQGIMVYSDCPAPPAPRVHADQCHIPPCQLDADPAVPACVEVLAKPVQAGVAMILVNYDVEDRQILCDIDCLAAVCRVNASVYHGVEDQADDCNELRHYHLRDLWKHADEGVHDVVNIRVPGDGGSVMLLLTLAEQGSTLSRGVTPSEPSNADLQRGVLIDLPPGVVVTD